MKRTSIITKTFILFLSIVTVRCADQQLSRSDVIFLREATALYRDRKFDDAEQKVSAVLKNRPQNIEAGVLLAKIKLYTRRSKEAERILRETLSRNEDNQYALMWLGRVLLLQPNRDEEAVTIFKRLLALNPENYMAHYYLGRCLERRNQYKPALLEYRRALAMEYQLARVHSHMADLFADLKLEDRSREHRRKLHFLGLNGVRTGTVPEKTDGVSRHRRERAVMR